MTTPAPARTFTEHSYYSGPMNGQITYYQNDVTGDCWWLNGNQWRYWDAPSQRWVFANIRTHDKHTNTVAGWVMAFVLLIAGGIIGGPAVPVMAIFAGVVVLMGLANTRIQNHHPQAYQAVVIASAVAGAAGAYKLGRRVHNLLDE